MNLTPIGALEILAFEASICHDGHDCDNLIARVATLCRALKIARPTLPHYDALRAALRDRLAPAGKGGGR